MVLIGTITNGWHDIAVCKACVSKEMVGGWESTNANYNSASSLPGERSRCILNQCGGVGGGVGGGQQQRHSFVRPLDLFLCCSTHKHERCRYDHGNLLVWVELC